MSDQSLLVFTPLEASNAAEQYVEEIKANDGDGMPLYIPEMEYLNGKGFLPVKRGELITVLGRPGSGKTGFMFRWARERAKELHRLASIGNKTAENSVVLYFTMEQLVEELRLFHVAAEEGISATDMANGKMEDAQWDNVTKSLRNLHTTPLWLAGRSLKRRKNKIPLNEEALRGVLNSIEKWQGENLTLQVDSFFVDYLQRFRSNNSDWVQFYGDLTNGLKEMAGDFGSRAIVGVQAKREVDQRKTPIPQMDDGQWTSAIEHQSDGMLSVVRPSHYKNENDFWDPDGDNVLVQGHKQMIVSCLKRKLGPENFKSWVSFAPEYNKLDRAEMKYFNPNRDRDNYLEVED
jgi:replicative DNA helicase